MSWGVTTSKSDRPAFVNDPKLAKSLVLTERGWEMRTPGTNNPKCMEVVVAGSFGITAANERPEIYEGSFPAGLGIEGISGSAIFHPGLEVVDVDKALGGDSVSVSATTGFPAGISLLKISSESDPTDFFRFSGTVTSATTGVGTVQFIDESGLTVAVQVPYTITAT